MKALTLLACVLLALAGCKTTTTPETDEVIAPPSVVRPVMLTRDDSGKTIDLQVGQTGTLALKGYPSGCDWEVADSDNDGVLTLIDKAYYPDPPKSTDNDFLIPGGHYVWTYKATQAGKATFSLSVEDLYLHRTDDTVATFDITFIVHE